MATKYDWSSPVPRYSNKKDDGKAKKSQVNRIKFTGNSTHIVRPIGKCVVFYQFYAVGRYWNADKEQLKELQELLGVEPKLKFAMNVIDRADNVIKILEGPISMLEDFKEVASATKTPPGSEHGGDWKITSTGEKQSRRYKVNYLGPQEFTPEELLRIKNPDKSKNEWYSLDDVYDASDPEDVKKYIEKFGTEGAQRQQPEQRSTKPVVVGAGEESGDKDDF